ncbi:MAG: TolC family protein, partial [Gemmatimonadetes bacterium]|nr:TolC family protein [Gemmatimonadota bacterium]
WIPIPPQAAEVAESDTLHLGVAEAFGRAVEAALDVAAAGLRAEAAEAREDQAARLPNPQFTVAAENLGKERLTTGLPAPDGIEGQAVLSPSLPFGPTRSGTVGAARAERVAAEARLERTVRQSAENILAGLGSLVRARTVARNARGEFATLELLADAVAAQAREGRVPESDASRAVLARGMAATALARKEGALAGAVGEVVRRLGVDAETWVELEVPVCAPGAADPLVPGPLPDVELARAEVEAANSRVSIARGLGLPDFSPAVGVRRAAGTEALYLGFSTTLPLFDLGGRRVAAARSETRAAEHELAALELRFAAERAAARRALEAVEAARVHFGAEWFTALDQMVTAAEARYDLGEGTLFELLDARRTRIQAMDDHAAWQAELWQARTRLARLSGVAPAAAVICSEPLGES